MTSLIVPLLALAPVACWGQDQVRPSSVAGRLFRPVSFEQRDYNVKAGPVTFRVSSDLRAEFNDNINLSEKQKTADVVISPSVSADMYWPLTPYNALRLNGSFGYQFYLAHPELTRSTSGVTISPDTELSFDLYVGSFRFNLHERPSVQQDPVGEATLSNVALFSRFTNTAGLSVEWAASSKLSLIGSYDHSDFISLTSQFSFADFAQDQLSFSSRLVFTDAITGGFEGSASSTRYRSADKADAIGTHAGVFSDVLLTPYTRFRVAGGFQSLRFDGTSASRIELLAQEMGRGGRLVSPSTRSTVGSRESGGNDSSYYVNLLVTNQLSRYYTHTLSIAKESQLGITSQSVDLWSIRYTAIWRVNSLLTLHGALLFDDGHESGARNPESFQRWGASVSTGFQLSRKLTLALGYDFILKDSNLEGESYVRNLLFLQLHYDF